MTVYADILILVNLIVDYFLLRISGKVLNISPKIWRILLASITGAVFSLYIFLPDFGVLADILSKVLMCGFMTAICFGFKNLKFFLKAAGILFAVTCLYAGIMIALWQIFRPDSMIINNSVVYFDISPLALIGFTVAGYFLYIIFCKIFSSSSKFALKCEITLFAGENSVGATAIIDTGNSITDIFGKSEIIIVDRAVMAALFGELDTRKNTALQARYRTVPCSTVAGGDVLDGYRCDRAKIAYEDTVIKLEKPIAAVSKTPLTDDYSAILNPKTLRKAAEDHGKTEKLCV